MLDIIIIGFFVVLFFYVGRLEGRLKHIQDTLARIEGKKGKK